jgi:hypothetical protein
VYRRPPSVANMACATEIMWDGREADLGSQAQNAHRIHAQAKSPLTARQLRRIVAFENGRFAAQIIDRAVGNLQEGAASGGPRPLAIQALAAGASNMPDRAPGEADLDAAEFTMFSAWTHLTGRPTTVRSARTSIARGQELFNTLPMTIGCSGLLRRAALIFTTARPRRCPMF